MSSNKFLVITASPYEWDDNLPWEYTVDSFVAWHEEVFREGYKKNNPPMGIEERISSLEEMGYQIFVDAKLLDSLIRNKLNY